MKADAETERANHGPLVSIVITTRNEEHNIGNCLRSVSLQDYTNIEVLVVDNNSTDHNKLIAQEFNVQVLKEMMGPVKINLHSLLLSMIDSHLHLNIFNPPNFQIF
jgi:glycosyltransferase involved in cell wall biosynthesis